MFRKTICFLILAVLCSSNVYALIHIVESNETLINSVILQSSPGDTIILSPDIYSQRIEILNHTITLGSFDILDTTSQVNRDITIIDGIDLDFTGRPLLHLEVDDEHFTMIQGLTFRNMNNLNGFEAAEGAAINSISSNIEVRDCSFYNNISTGGSALKCEGNKAIFRGCLVSGNSAINCAGIMAAFCHIDVIDCVFEENSTINMDGGAISILYGSGRIENNLIRDNYAHFWGAGIYSTFAGKLLIRRNTFSENVAWNDGGAIRISNCDTLKVYANIFSKNICSILEPDSTTYLNGAAISLNGTSSFSLITNNTFISNTSAGLVYARRSDTTIKHNMFVGNKGFSYALIDAIGSVGMTNTVNVLNNAFKYTGCYEGHELRYIGAVTAQNDVLMEIEGNDFIENSLYAIGPYRNPGEIEMAGNYFGHATGPYHASSNPTGLGDSVHVDIELGQFSSEESWMYGLEFDVEEFDFGHLEVGQRITENVSLRNVSTHVLTVNQFGLVDENAFSIPRIDSLTLAPGEVASVPVTFEPDEEKDYYTVLATVSTQSMATGSTIEIFGSGQDDIDVDEIAEIPNTFDVSTPYPNPFNNQTRIKVNMPEDGKLNVSIYDIQGRIVKKIVSSIYNGGTHSFSINMSDQSSGIYFVKVSTAKNEQSLKLVMIR